MMERDTLIRVMKKGESGIAALRGEAMTAI